MEIKEVKFNRKEYISLLLLADEQENMIDRYIDKGKMYILLDEGSVKSQCIVTEDKKGVLEIKSISTKPDFQRRGYGRALIEFVIKNSKERCRILIVGTGDGGSAVPFYEKCGFKRSHVIKNFFTDNYDHEIYENGIKLKDMVYMKMEL